MKMNKISDSIIGISEIIISKQFTIPENIIEEGIKISNEWDTVVHVVERSEKFAVVRKLDDDSDPILSFDGTGVFLNEMFDVKEIKSEKNRFAKIDIKNFAWQNKLGKFQNGERMMNNKICLAEINWDGVHGKGYNVFINLPGYDHKEWKTQPDIKSAKELCERIVSRWFIEMGAIFE